MAHSSYLLMSWDTLTSQSRLWVQLCHFALAHGANQDRSSDRRGHISQLVCVSLCVAVKYVHVCVYIQILQSRRKHSSVFVEGLDNFCVSSWPVGLSQSKVLNVTAYILIWILFKLFQAVCVFLFFFIEQYNILKIQ